MASTRLAPGFRFHPTDVELIMYYLKRKVLGKKLCITAISELNIYKLDPWDLPDKSCIKSEDRQWYFFCPREKKYASGGRMNRSAETGYWKGTGKDRSVLYKGRVVGMVKTLIFHQGHPPKGERTDWVMHEYRLEDQQLAEAGVPQDAFVICKLFHKDGPGARKNAQYGATFKEEEWDEKTVYCDETMTTETLSVALSGGTQLQATSSTLEPATMTTGNLSAAITGGTQLLATPSTSELTTLTTGNLSVAIAGGTQFLATPSTSELTTMGGPEISSICPSHEQGPPSLHGDGVGIPSMEDVDFQSVWDFFTEEDISPGQYDGPVIGDPSSENDLFSGLPDLSTFPTCGGSSSFSFSEMQPFQDSYLELDDLNNWDPNSYLELNDLNNCNPNSYFNDHSRTDPSLPCYGFPDFSAGQYFLGSTQVCLQPAGTNEAPKQNSYAQ